MAKANPKKAFFCRECGNESRQWAGRCPACGAWNAIVEAPVDKPSAANQRWVGPGGASQPLQQLSEVSLQDAPRVLLPSGELNRVLGGGIVPGSIVLLAGDPGIGKSTLFLQMAAALAAKGGDVLYVSGEESARQIRMRAERLGVTGEHVFLLNETSIEEVLQRAEQSHPAALVVDSIQTMATETIPSAPGSVNQVRECCRLLLQWAKSTHTPVLLTGHVTKEGDIAGPRVLEHMVDVVLYLEGEQFGPVRLLRSIKNRFGSTNEVAVLQMESSGLVEVPDPSRALLATRHGNRVGSAVVPILEGTRPLMVEIQALTAPTVLPVPRRLSSGLEQNRVVMLTAILSQRAGLAVGMDDVIVNVTGGLRVSEPAADLCASLAIASSFRNVPLSSDVIAIGEVGLSGELRWVSQMERRLREASRLGFTRAIIPAIRGDAANIGPIDGLEVVRVETLREAIRQALPRANNTAKDNDRSQAAHEVDSEDEG
ncbi:MAG: DNA repair protein RadA [Dehalococcoidia bacterium]|nr:DNA repair protein RadA [Dehalococcoidia bacterium]